MAFNILDAVRAYFGNEMISKASNYLGETDSMEYLRKEKIRAEVVWLDETDADYFIPRIDSSWTGALPATLLSSKGIAKPLFFDRQLKPEELEKAIRKILHPDESNKK